MQRINPLVTASVKGAKEMARWDNEERGICPVCTQEGNPQEMRLAKTQLGPVYVCLEHHVCLPVENGNPALS